MNKAQKILLVCAALIAATLIANPPWIEMYFAETGQSAQDDRGYHLVWNKPEARFPDRQRMGGVRIHSSKLSGRLMILGIVTFVGYVTLGRKLNRYQS